MVQLTVKELEWLGINYPQLYYNAANAVISGPLNFSLSYKGRLISDCYNIEICLGNMRSRQELPSVFNTDNRIVKMAKRKKRSSDDFHINHDGSLCLILPQRFKEQYPSGFTLPLFMNHLTNHLYWVTYFERYEQEPWAGEKHGVDAVVDYWIEHPEIIVKEDIYLEFFRMLYKKKKSRGICKSKLRRQLLTTNLAKWIIYG